MTADAREGRAGEGICEGNELKELVWNTYRVLLTRGMQSTMVYSTDFETRRFLKSLID